MADFRHEPDFNAYQAGDLFREYATVGGNPPGHIIVDEDGEKALLFQVAGVWLTYKDKFANIDLMGTINCANTIRIDDPLLAPGGYLMDWYAFDGVSTYSGYVVLLYKGGRIYLKAYDSWPESQYHPNNPLAVIDCGPWDKDAHKVAIAVQGQTLTMSFDGSTATAQLRKPGRLVDSFRVRACGVITSQDKKTRVVTTHYCTIIKHHAVWGPAKA